MTPGSHLLKEGRVEELEALAVKTNELCERLCRNEEMKRAVYIWSQAVVARTVSAEVFATTWRVLERYSFATVARLETGTSSSDCKISSAVVAKECDYEQG